MNIKREFSSQFDVDEKVEFVVSARDADKMKIEREWSDGQIVAVRFTKSKVFYDVLSEYYGFVFRDIDSCGVRQKQFLTDLLKSAERN